LCINSKFHIVIFVIFDFKLYLLHNTQVRHVIVTDLWRWIRF
jgi:hypothetical protein